MSTHCCPESLLSDGLSFCPMTSADAPEAKRIQEFEMPHISNCFSPPQNSVI